VPQKLLLHKTMSPEDANEHIGTGLRSIVLVSPLHRAGHPNNILYSKQSVVEQPQIAQSWDQSARASIIGDASFRHLGVDSLELRYTAARCLADAEASLAAPA
jgi:hypothetical protein